MGSYKEVLVDILEALTCPRCKDIFNCPVTLDCGHSVCWACAEKIRREDGQGQRCCCCPQCGVESLMEDLWIKLNLTLLDVAAVVHGHAASLRKERSAPEGRTAGDSESGLGDLKSEYSLGSSCSIRSMDPPLRMAPKGKLFDRMTLVTDGLENEELSQRPSGSSDCSESKQRPEDEASAWLSLSGSGGLFECKLPQQSTLASTSAHIMDLLTHTTSDGTQGSVKKTRPYKQAPLAVLQPLTCLHCREILTYHVPLDCGHTVCLACARNIGNKNKEGQRCCCCPQCGVESLMEVLCLKLNRTLWEVAAVVRGQAASLGKGRSIPEPCSAGDSGGGDLRSECSVGSSCSIRSLDPPPHMASKRELFDRMFILTDGLESVDELSQWSCGSSDCSEREQLTEDEVSTRGPLSGLGRYLSRGLLESKLPQQSSCTSRLFRMDLLTEDVSAVAQKSVFTLLLYKTQWYKQAFLAVLDRLTCPHCKEVFACPVTLDCGHSVCLACAEKTGSKNKKGQRCCCCPKCGTESVTEDVLSRVHLTLLSVADVVRGHAASLEKGRSTPAACSAGDSGVRDLMSKCSFGSSCSSEAWTRHPSLHQKDNYLAGCSF